MLGVVILLKVPSPVVVQVIDVALPPKEALIRLRISPSQIVVSFPALTIAAGSTVKSIRIESPIQPPKEGVISMVVVMLERDPFKERKAAMLPLPDTDGKPIFVAFMGGVASH